MNDDDNFPDADQDDQYPEGSAEEALNEDRTSTLVQISDDLAILYGERTDQFGAIVPFTFDHEQLHVEVWAALGSSAGFGNLAAQGINGMMQAQGLVRLAPETLKYLETATPLMKDGWNLGILMNSGKFAHQIRWAPAAGANAATFAASMGTAVALMAIQLQLDHISKLAQRNVELTTTVLKTLREQHWSEVTGYYRTIVKELHHARTLGSVPDSIFDNVRGYGAMLTTLWERSEGDVRKHLVELRQQGGHKERQQYLTQNGESIIADVQALLLAKDAWFTYQALRAGNLLLSVESNPDNKKLLEDVVEKARSLHDSTLKSTDWLLEELAREFTVIAVLQGKRTFKIGGSARAAKDVAAMVRQLQGALTSIRDPGGAFVQAPFQLPSILIFEGEVPDALSLVLPLRLLHGERVLAMAEATGGMWNLPFLDAGWVAVTDRRLMVTKQDSLRRYGAIDIALNLEDIRYVRALDSEGKSPSLEVIANSFSLTLKFPSWAKKAEFSDALGRFRDLLASFMNLPTSEIPKMKPIELEARTDD